MIFWLKYRKKWAIAQAEITYKTYYRWLPKESRTDIDELGNAQPSATTTKKGVSRFWLTPFLIFLVAGAGFEPATFGL